MPATITILLTLFGAILAIGLAVVLLIYVVVPAFKAVGWLIAHIFRFIGGEIGDFFRLIGSVITGFVLVPMVVFNIVIGRWSASSHFGRAVQNEFLTAGVCVYRIFIGHPARLLGLQNVTEGIEQRLPQVVAEAPGSDKPSRQTGKFEGYTIIGSLRGGGSGGKLYIAEPDQIRMAAFARAGQDGVERVVIKSFSIDDGSSLPQIIRESRALDSAKKLGLVLDHELTDDRFHYIMRYVPGESLGIVTGNMHGASGESGLDDASLRHALSYIADLLRTLNEYHRGGLWHKDVKPDNIIIHDDRAHLVDLGLVTPMRSAMTLTTHGTEYFRDPEMVRLALKGVKVHQVDGAKFDIYAVGAVLYSIIENSFPAHGGLSQVSKRCPESLRWVIRRSMADYDKRYTTAQQMLDDLEAIQMADDPFVVKPVALPSMGGHESSVDAPLSTVTPRSFESVWQRISSMEGEQFSTIRGKQFTYEVSGNILIPSIDSQFQLHKSNFKKAFERGRTTGPGAISDVHGPSYVWAILHDDRVGAFAGDRTHSDAPLDNPAFDAIWARISAAGGRDIRTRDGEAFRFSADAKGVRPNVVDYPIARASFERAFDLGPNIGPGELGQRVRGGSYVWAIMHSEAVGAFPPMPASPEIPIPPAPPTPPSTPEAPVQRSRPKLRVTNWWTGGYAPEGAEQVEVRARRTPMPPRAGAGRVHAEGGSRIKPVELRAPAHEQLKNARARATAARERAQARTGHRRRLRKSADPTGVNAGVAFSVFLFLATCVAFAGVFIGGGVLNSRKVQITIDEQSDGQLITATDGRIVGLNLEAMGESLGISARDAGIVAITWLNEIKQSPEAIRMIQQSHADPVVTINEDGRPVLSSTPNVVHLTDARLLFVSDFLPPLDSEVRVAYEIGLSALANAGVTLVGDVPADMVEGVDQIELMAQAERARGSQPLDSSDVAGDLMDWLIETDAADLILWIEPASIGDAGQDRCARYLIVGESGMLRGSVNDCGALTEVFQRTLRAAIDWR